MLLPLSLLFWWELYTDQIRAKKGSWLLSRWNSIGVRLSLLIEILWRLYEDEYRRQVSIYYTNTESGVIIWWTFHQKWRNWVRKRNTNFHKRSVVWRTISVTNFWSDRTAFLIMFWFMWLLLRHSKSTSFQYQESILFFECIEHI